MPQIIIPPQDTKQFVKPSKGELFGNLWATKNIDLESNKGKLRLSERLYRLFDSGDDADLEIPVKFIRSNADQTEKWWSLTQSARSSVSDGLLFKTTGVNPLVGWVQDAIANSPTDCVDDMEIFGQANSYDRLVVSRDTDLAMLNNGTWTASWWVTTLSQAALTATNPHPIEQFINKLLVIDGNVVHTIDDSLVVVPSRIVLPKEYQIIWTAKDGSNVYFGTRHLRGGEALIFPWNGTDETYGTPIPVDSYISLAGVVPKEGVLHTINGKGQLLRFNGIAFDVVASLPISEKILKWANQTKRIEMVHPNGMTMIGNEICFLLDAATDEDAPGLYFYEEFRPGIWAYNEDIGLYNKYSLGQYDGTTSNDWGASTIRYPGALVETDLMKGRFLAGCGVYSDNASTLINGVFVSKIDATSDQRGNFITSQIQSQSIRSFWKRLMIAFKKLENSTDRIIVKYRTDVIPDRVSDGRMNTFVVTWADTSSFVTTQAGVGSVIAVGDEIEIMVGKGAGALAHVLSATVGGYVGGNDYLIVLDEAITGASGDSYAVVNRWKRLGIISDQTLQQKLFKIAKRSTWIQFKVELRGIEKSPEVEQLLLDFEYSKR